ncbi:Hypothetical protein FKW44_020921 [Caligus rogercresseyi]|uniref:Uncharacterized protein n=1 Tax=Caligus rogercresseyi TaxID=217165 RepID=A0A7T8GQM2_CALRO|nr:Hypothetical protein FKW44_020921 [Caligus rogercresseyi]
MTSADSNTFVPPLNPLPEGLTEPVFRDGPPRPGSTPSGRFCRRSPRPRASSS